jgi:hypothetical protein
MNMKPFFFGLRDFFGRWAIDLAGTEQGSYTTLELREMLDRGEIGPHTWLRHVWTRRYSLVGETLWTNKLATPDEFEEWFPARRDRIHVPTAA